MTLTEERVREIVREEIAAYDMKAVGALLPNASGSIRDAVESLVDRFDGGGEDGQEIGDRGDSVTEGPVLDGVAVAFDGEVDLAADAHAPIVGGAS